MEPVLIESYRVMLKSHPVDCSVDRILCDPELRAEFLELVRARAGERCEFDVLHGLNNLRKRSRLPRRDDDEPRARCAQRPAPNPASATGP
ncbi:hypothetical protein GobsT_67250 [Gemmata obscuriglobus]|uniref:Uncharacterized protein n=1 Tax=Gemmata obscuriglobus TaxID=114 RepID=A0A2Z3GN13_9BACT|nr:hypothetical protein [Gemmata obscuriglobus]AWM35599.1 hypothetical protein C1280_00210 [Gemmata obscuriglobus]QEG31878.1 hypothetical protein GobsT_67250 [Gemmata obscuriglobus]VTS11224.1 unnamed protein product [Gemmata obscuriglobus UQM 2246]